MIVTQCHWQHLASNIQTSHLCPWLIESQAGIRGGQNEEFGHPIPKFHKYIQYWATTLGLSKTWRYNIGNLTEQCKTWIKANEWDMYKNCSSTATAPRECNLRDNLNKHAQTKACTAVISTGVKKSCSKMLASLFKLEGAWKSLSSWTLSPHLAHHTICSPVGALSAAN